MVGVCACHFGPSSRRVRGGPQLIQFALRQYDGKPAVVTQVDDVRSSKRIRFEHNCHQVLHGVSQLGRHRFLEGIVARQLVLVHLFLVVSVKGIDLVEHDEQHHAATPYVALERIVRGLLEDLGWIVRSGAAVGVRLDHLA